MRSNERIVVIIKDGVVDEVRSDGPCVEAIILDADELENGDAYHELCSRFPNPIWDAETERTDDDTRSNGPRR